MCIDICIGMCIDTFTDTTSVPILTPVMFCMSVPFGTCTAEIAESRFVVAPGCNMTIGSRGSPTKKFVKKTGPIYKF